MARVNDTISRRSLLTHGIALSAPSAAQGLPPAWMPRLAFAPANRAPRGDVLVVVFLRGGADGLNIIVPHGEQAYYDARPNLAVARPDDNKAGAANRAYDLDGFFGLHPALGPLLPIFKAKQLVAVHATGSPDFTRSHFDAMDYMERGTPGSHSLNTGWIARHLATLDTGTNAPIRAIGWGAGLQQSLRGSVSAAALKSIVDYHLRGRQETTAEVLAALNALYAANPATLKASSDQTSAIFDLVTKVNIAAYKPANGAAYDDQEDFDMALMQTAALIKADVGLEVSAIDLGGWDTHLNQLIDLNAQLKTLASGLAAFHADMGDAMKDISMIVMSEFGRRVQENASAGTDHGHGNIMMLMGGHVAAKPVVANWPGLAAEALVDGDLASTTDYRDVLCEVLTIRLNNPAVQDIFPDFTPTLRGVVTK